MKACCKYQPVKWHHNDKFMGWKVLKVWPGETPKTEDMACFYGKGSKGYAEEHAYKLYWGHSL